MVTNEYAGGVASRDRAFPPRPPKSVPPGVCACAGMAWYRLFFLRLDRARADAASASRVCAPARQTDVIEVGLIKMPARGRRRACVHAAGAVRPDPRTDGHGRPFKVLRIVRFRNRDGARHAWGKRAGCCCAGGAGRPPGEQKRKAQRHGRAPVVGVARGRTRAARSPPPPHDRPPLCAAPRAHACM
jgi:hypothetical protein